MKKFELTNEFITIGAFGKKLFRIRALADFGDVRAGELGGYVEKEENLSHDDNAWIFDDACVCDNACVFGNARVTDYAHIRDNALVYGNARVSGDARVSGNAYVSGNALVTDNAWVSGNACITGNALICSEADYTTIKGFGREYRNTTFFRNKYDKIYVVCGGFYGDLEEFRKIVMKTHGNSKMAKEYLVIADLMEMHFK